MTVEELDESRLVHRLVEVSAGVRLHVVECGTGPLVILLHGFPDFWFAWRKQIPALAAAGFRVLAPDLRGYNASDKPGGVRAYGLRTLARDVAALVDGAGADRASVIGHDWGAGVAWAVAMSHPEKVAHLATIDGPHPNAMREALLSPSQLARLWYVAFFQLPILPEAYLSRNDFAVLSDTLRRPPTHSSAVTEADLARYREAWGKPGALHAMLNWYRAMLRPGGAVASRPVEVPVFVLWGKSDPYLSPTMARPNPLDVPNARVEVIDGAGHWPHLDEAEIVNAHLLAFLTTR
jgi:pimeloyl-ACP methyl ester carboxylesterase